MKDVLGDAAPERIDETMMAGGRHYDHSGLHLSRGTQNRRHDIAGDRGELWKDPGKLAVRSVLFADMHAEDLGGNTSEQRIVLPCRFHRRGRGGHREQYAVQVQPSGILIDEGPARRPEEQGGNACRPQRLDGNGAGQPPVDPGPAVACRHQQVRPVLQDVACDPRNRVLAVDLDLADLDAEAVVDVLLCGTRRQQSPGLERVANLREVLPGGLP
jgi:hypothetical protein